MNKRIRFTLFHKKPSVVFNFKDVLPHIILHILILH